MGASYLIKTHVCPVCYVPRRKGPHLSMLLGSGAIGVNVVHSLGGQVIVLINLD